MKQLNTHALDQLSAQAKCSPRLRMNANLHEDLADPIQRLAIAMEPNTLIRPHRHQKTWELLTALTGRFVVLHFDEQGYVVERVVLGEECKVQETQAGVWHAVLSLDSGGVIFEVKHGPYAPFQPEDFAPGFADESKIDADELNAWYATAKVGDQLPTVFG